jgi:CRP-like cAMP-binding protein
MDDLDFTTASRDKIYDPGIARTCFESFGKTCKLDEGDAFFAENEESKHMYLLLEGEVRLFRGIRVLDIVRAGEIFGEMAVITGQTRSAWAVARKPCKAIMLEPAQFQEAIRATPEFALMLMRIMFNRLRLTSAFLNKSGRLRNSGGTHDKVFDSALVKDLASAMRSVQPATLPKNTIIMREGESGDSMYVVLSGKVSVAIQGTLVEHVGAGGMFGEMALVNDSPRAATAIALTDVRLLPISRYDFMNLVKSHPAFAVSLLKAVAARLARQTAKSV